MKKMDELLTEYDRLKRKIDEAKAPAEELANARAKLQKVEQQLIDMNPNILKSEGAKTEISREQAEIERDKLKMKQQAAKLDLQAAVIEAESEMPEQKKLYQEAVEEQKKWENEYRTGIERAQKLIKFRERAQKIQSDREHRIIDSKKEDELLRQLAKEVIEETGISSGGISTTTEALQKSLDEVIEKYNEANQKKEEAEQNVKELSDAAVTAFNNFKKLAEIEAGLEIPIEEAAKKYNELTTDQKANTEAVIKKIHEFARNLAGLPDEKKIEIKTLFTQIGLGPPSLEQLVSRMESFGKPKEKVEAYEDGGIGTKPHMGIFAEKGPEAYIPLAANKRSRALSLYDKVGKALGVRDYSTGGLRSKLESPNLAAVPAASAGNVTIGDLHITIQGNADDKAIAELRRELDQYKRNLLGAIQEATRQKGRVSLA
ncbi:hypothetical protein J6TS7_66070 [Paenibacillus dendritiformis]|nr:hypothetical protein J6TS7_66070 [Paenibacillus dendritiformis]